MSATADSNPAPLATVEVLVRIPRRNASAMLAFTNSLRPESSALTIGNDPLIPSYPVLLIPRHQGCSRKFLDSREPLRGVDGQGQ